MNSLQRLRRAVIAFLLERDGLVCELCHLEIASGESIEIDHIIQVAEGGPDVVDNLRLTHEACNQKRPKIHPAHWVSRQAEIRQRSWGTRRKRYGPAGQTKPHTLPKFNQQHRKKGWETRRTRYGTQGYKNGHPKQRKDAA